MRRVAHNCFHKWHKDDECECGGSNMHCYIVWPTLTDLAVPAAAAATKSRRTRVHLLFKLVWRLRLTNEARKQRAVAITKLTRKMQLLCHSFSIAKNVWLCLLAWLPAIAYTIMGIIFFIIRFLIENISISFSVSFFFSRLPSTVIVCWI